MQQMTLGPVEGFQRSSKKTRQENVLGEMDAVTPWVELLALVALHDSKGKLTSVLQHMASSRRSGAGFSLLVVRRGHLGLPAPEFHATSRPGVRLRPERLYLHSIATPRIQPARS